MKTFVLGATLIAVLCAVSPLQASSPEDVILYPGKPGLMLIPYLGASVNLHNGTLMSSELGSRCCGFDGGTGIGFLAGARTFIPWLEDWQLSPRIAVLQRGGTFTAEAIRLPIRGAGNALEHAVLEQTMTLSLSTLSLDGLVTYLLPDSRAYLLAGPALHLVMGSDVSSQERIIDPAGVTFLDGTRSRSVIAPTIEQSAGASLHVRLGAGTWLRVPAGFEINPEVLVDLPVTRATSDGTWKVYGIQLNIGVGFEL